MKSLQVTPPVQKLKDSFYERYQKESVELRHTVYHQTFAAHSGESAAMKIARSFAAFLALKPVVVEPYDILAGQLQLYDVSASTPISYSAGFDPAYVPLRIHEDAYTFIYREVKECRCYLGELDQEDESALDLLQTGLMGGYFTHWPVGHVIPGFKNVLKYGYGELKRRIKARMQDNHMTEEQLDYLNAMLITVCGVQEYIGRYADAAFAMLPKSEEEQRQNLKRIEQGCRNIMENRPASFFEAVQSVLLLQEMLVIENSSGSMSLGRMDQLFYPFYAEDVKKGIITEDDAQELIDVWRVKLAGIVIGFQNVTIGGCGPDGQYAGNDITRMILYSTRKLRYDQPLLSLRYTSDTPEEIFEEAVNILSLGDGFPALFNDEVVIESLQKKGIAKEDAWNYGIVGCVEQSIGGREFSNTEEMRINWCKTLELMLSEGVCRSSGRQYTMKRQIPLDEIKDFNTFKGWYKEELEYVIRRAAHACNLIDSIYDKAYPAALLSLTMDGCIENAKDVNGVGTIYRFSSINNTGMANVVDSLVAINKLVFKEGRLTLTQFSEVLKANFEGYEGLRAEIRSSCEKFGNGEEEPDALMEELVSFSSDVINSIENCRGAHFCPGFYSVQTHGLLGIHTGALPDGRLAKETLANGFCPVQGADQKGPTAVMHSVTRCPHTEFGNGMVLDIKFNPSFFRDEVHRKMFRPLVQTYFDQGGMELQLNVVDRETLMKAQEKPDEYKNLIVRVSGFSAYFVMLDKMLQDEIIKRTEYADG